MAVMAVWDKPLRLETWLDSADDADRAIIAGCIAGCGTEHVMIEKRRMETRRTVVYYKMHGDQDVCFGAVECLLIKTEAR